jgi:hypothetical protein
MSIGPIALIEPIVSILRQHLQAGKKSRKYLKKSPASRLLRCTYLPAEFDFGNRP